VPPAASASFHPLPAPTSEPPRLVGVEVEIMPPRHAAWALATGIGGEVVVEDAHAFGGISGRKFVKSALSPQF